VLIPQGAVVGGGLSDGDVEDDEEDGGATEEPSDKPLTLCVSTQVGCAMGCVFCASGQAGLKRGLGAHEIISQLIVARRHLDPGERIKNLVFMGMGEPLHHYAETARTIHLLTHPLGHAMSPRRITVSSVGLLSGIRRLGEEFGGKVGLAISLHAPDSATRSQIIPMNEHQPLAELMQALRAYPLPKRRRITIEYTLIDGVNDRPEHARQLAATLRGLPSKVNLIPMNPIRESSLRAPSPDAVEAFRRELARLRVSCSVRQTRGDDVDAACGQLALSQG
jgi:23S rRNA (adenine2503-C2)-methyltransferase